MMQAWLGDRGQAVTGVDAHHADGWEPMPGMLTPDEMAELAAATGNAFDRLFLERMIEHHRGAVTMVENLLEQRGAAQDSELFAFTSDVTSDQTAEIDRMDTMLAGLSPDPRVGLAAGFEDAGQAASNMALVATRAKPAGFFDPHRPAGRRLPVEPDAEPEAGDAEPEQEEEEEEEDPRRRGLLGFGITDLAFAGDRLFVGSYHGFNTYGIETPASPRLIASVVCPGGQGDVSVVGDLLIMSVEQTRGRVDCGLQGVAEPVSAERFRGIRVFDISDLRRPRQVAAVQTCRGSHTHTVVTGPDEAGDVYV